MGEWQCEQSGVTSADRMAVWSFWTNMDHHVEMEPGVKSIEVDGAFVTGTTGRTITEHYEQEWQLTDVLEGRRFGITGFTPDGQGSLTFSWQFDDHDAGTCITYRIAAQGPDVESQVEVWRQFEINAPEGLAALIEKLDALSLS